MKENQKKNWNTSRLHIVVDSDFISIALISNVTRLARFLTDTRLEHLNFLLWLSITLFILCFFFITETICFQYSLRLLRHVVVVWNHLIVASTRLFMVWSLPSVKKITHNIRERILYDVERGVFLSLSSCFYWYSSRHVDRRNKFCMQNKMQKHMLEHCFVFLVEALWSDFFSRAKRFINLNLIRAHTHTLCSVGIVSYIIFILFRYVLLLLLLLIAYDIHI